MASVMAIGSEGFGRCVEGIRVEVGLKILRLCLLCLAFFVDGLGDWMGESCA